MFDITKLTCKSGETAGTPREYDYFSADVVTVAGYFDDTSGLKAGDRVNAVNITYTGGLVSAYSVKSYFIKANSAGVLTATLIVYDASNLP
jgi:hypothetical protein